MRIALLGGNLLSPRVVTVNMLHCLCGAAGSIPVGGTLATWHEVGYDCGDRKYGVSQLPWMSLTWKGINHSSKGKGSPKQGEAKRLRRAVRDGVLAGSTPVTLIGVT